MIFCFCLTVSAQSQNNGHIDFSLGYSYIHASPSTANMPSFSLNGGSMAGAWNFGNWSVVGDLGGYHVGSIGGKTVDANLVTFLGGGRFTLHRTQRARLFVQGLVGGAHSNAASFQQAGVTTKTALAVAAGGGVDWYFSPGIGFRGQADYLATRFQEKAGTTSTQNNIRITAGIVLRF
jgi:hypothetical protein